MQIKNFKPANPTAFWITVIAVVALLGLAFSGQCNAQTSGVNYAWSDTATVNVTGRDSLFTTVWESVNIWFRGGDGYLRFAFNSAGDTTNWSSKKYIRLAENQVLSFDSGTKLKRLQWKALTGNVVTYFVGYKKVRQF